MTPTAPRLFLDDEYVRDGRNLARRLHQPAKHPANPLLVREHPWEAHAIQTYGNVLHEDGRFRFWYFAAEERDPTDVPWEVADRGRPARVYNICYAESDDGIAWHRAMVTPRPFPPYERHNILISDMHSVCVLRDDDDPDLERRYKALGGRKTALSPDGIHWRTRINDAVGKNDTGSSVLWWQGQYLAFVRQQEREPEWPVVRAVGLSTSPDFDTWTPKETVLTTDAVDGYPFTQPYGLTVFARGDLLIGILWTILLDREETGPEVAWKWNNRLGDIRMELVCSRDGRRWTRVAERAAFLEPTPGAWDGTQLRPATSVLVHDGRMWFYYTGTDGRHGAGFGDPGIGLATLPEDRMVGLVAADAGTATFRTPIPATSDASGDLLANADLTDGSLVVEVLTADGAPAPGFGAGDCRLVAADDLRWRVCWGERGLAAAPAGGQLRVTLSGAAELFALQTG